ncbi:MAG: helix-turn-helix domain-containing protein [Pseudomonadota bacterium]
MARDKGRTGGLWFAARREFERVLVAGILDRCDGNKAAAARELGISYTMIKIILGRDPMSEHGQDEMVATAALAATAAAPPAEADDEERGFDGALRDAVLRGALARLDSSRPAEPTFERLVILARRQMLRQLRGEVFARLLAEPMDTKMTESGPTPSSRRQHHPRRTSGRPPNMQSAMDKPRRRGSTTGIERSPASLPGSPPVPRTAALHRIGYYSNGREVFVVGATAIWCVQSSKLEGGHPERRNALPKNAFPIDTVPFVYVPAYCWQ